MKWVSLSRKQKLPKGVMDNLQNPLMKCVSVSEIIMGFDPVEDSSTLSRTMIAGNNVNNCHSYTYPYSLKEGPFAL